MFVLVATARFPRRGPLFFSTGPTRDELESEFVSATETV
jgi:hypothetical protein